MGNGDMLCALAYADDIALLADSENSLQLLLDELSQWCKNWRVSVNIQKTKVMHFRKPRKTRTDRMFAIGEEKLEIVDSYKYLGIHLDETVSEKVIVEPLVQAGSWALSVLIGKTRTNYDLGYKSFTTLYHMTVIPIMEYFVGAWSVGLMNDRTVDQVQERTSRFYGGLPRFTPLIAIAGISGWTPGVVRKGIETLRFYNHLIELDSNRLCRKVYEMDKRFNGAWSENVKTICICCSQLESWECNTIVNLKQAEKKLLEL